MRDVEGCGSRVLLSQRKQAEKSRVHLFVKKWKEVILLLLHTFSVYTLKLIQDSLKGL